MAKAVINLQKESGGIVKISSADGTGVTELVVPESGNLVSVDTAVTDNAIARYDGTTGKLQNSSVRIDANGNLLLTSGTGALGYGAGAGGTVTQLTSKGTAVVLNKPTGSIMLNNSALGAGQTAGFYMYNGLSSQGDVCVVAPTTVNYNTSGICENGLIYFRITNILDIPLSEYVHVRFAIIRGVNS